jgi:TolB-like protein
MTNDSVHRRLAAILAADVVGYSLLMKRDEAGTVAALKQRRREVLTPAVERHGGRIIKIMGDGVLVEFASAVNAVACAIDLQHGMEDANAGLADSARVRLRIGINLGDVIVEGGDLYGDGVNIAARLESVAEPGGICVSATVHEHVGGKLACGFRSLGHQVLKNIDRPVNVFAVDEGSVIDVSCPPLPEAPSIAVLPFQTMSRDPEQESFADGLTEDLITELSKANGLFVIARHSSFAYKGRTADIRQIARELGVRYVLEGSARRSADRLRISAQLIDALGGEHGGGHLWAERFDRDLADFFTVQDDVTAKIVEALIGRLTGALPPRNRPANLEAYELCVRSRYLNVQSLQSLHEGKHLLERAIELEPNYSEPHRWLALALHALWVHWSGPEIPNRARAIELAEQAIALDPNDAGARWVLGHLLVYERRWAESEASFDAAFRLDPNHADAWAMRSHLSVVSGELERATSEALKALRLNPRPPGVYYWCLGQTYYARGLYEDAVKVLKHPEIYRSAGRRMLAASLAQLGRSEEARREMELFRISAPSFTIGHWARTQGFRDEAVKQHFIEGFRKAGLPE